MKLLDEIDEDSVIVVDFHAEATSEKHAFAWYLDGRVAAVVGSVAPPLLVAYALLPGAPDPVDVPATLVWRFRVAALGGNLVLWTVLSLGFGVAATFPARRPRVAPAPTGAHAA